MRFFRFSFSRRASVLAKSRAGLVLFALLIPILTPQSSIQTSSASKINSVRPNLASVPTSSAQILPATGLALVQLLKEAAGEIVTRAGEQGRAVANEAAAGLLRVAADLERALGENIRKPLAELRETFRVEVERGLVALQQTQYFLNATARCLVNDFQGLLAGFKGTLTHNIADAVPWASKAPIVFRTERIDTGAPYGLRTNSRQTLALVGANLKADDRCGVSAEMSRVDGEAGAASVRVISHDPQRINVLVDPLTNPGTYLLRVRLGQKRRILPGCGSPKFAQAVVAVLPPARFHVSYLLQPTCRVPDTREFAVARVDGDNTVCDGDKYFENVGVVPDGFTYVSHRWHEESCAGCHKEIETYLGGGRVRVKYRVAEKGGPFCTGKNKWVHGQLYITGTRLVDQRASDLAGSFPAELTYGQTVSAVVSPSRICQENGAWAASAKVIFPDGTVHDIPAVQGAGPLTNAADGAAFSWNPISYTMSITTPPNSCGGL